MRIQLGGRVTAENVYPNVVVYVGNASYKFVSPTKMVQVSLDKEGRLSVGIR